MPVGFNKNRICNMALSNVGSNSNIEDVDTERSPAASECRLWYDAARLVTLEAHNWGFARKRKLLALHAEEPPEDWAYRYQWPVDCVGPRLIINPIGPDADAVPFTVEMGDDDTRCILTNMEKATLVYTRDLENVLLYSTHAVVMLSLQLGIYINPKITGKARIATRLQQEFDRMAILAPEKDTDEEVPKKERDASWIRARA